MLTSNVAYAAGAYLPTKTRSQASLQRALVSKSAATKVASIQSHPIKQQKYRKYFFHFTLYTIHYTPENSVTGYGLPVTGMISAAKPPPGAMGMKRVSVCVTASSSCTNA